jgi:hypothetical protein
MHFLGASRDGQVARPVEMDKLSSSVSCPWQQSARDTKEVCIVNMDA